MNTYQLRRALTGALLVSLSIAACGGNTQPGSPLPPGCQPGSALVVDAGPIGCGTPTAISIVGDPATCPRDPQAADALESNACYAFCGQPGTVPGTGVSCTVGVDPGSNKTVVFCHRGCGGRMPEGLEALAFDAHSAGALFARAAYLEAASVEAFRILRAELEAHGAPRALLADAERAAEDEVKHARMMRGLARRFGATTPKPNTAARAARSLEEIARENEVEGCVRETYGAALAAHQARASEDPAVRAAMAVIAKDEERHALLGWRVSCWARSRLDAGARARVAEARSQAVAALERELCAEPSHEARTLAGLPSVAASRALVASLRGTLWS